MLHFFRRRQGANPQFFNAQRAVIVRVEGNTRMIVGVKPQHFLCYQFQSEQKLGAVAQQQIHIRTPELDENIGVLKIRVAVIARLNRESQMKPGVPDNPAKKSFNSWTRFLYRILGTQTLFLPLPFCGRRATGVPLTGTNVLLKNHCCAMPTRLPVSQYNTSPLD